MVALALLWGVAGQVKAGIMTPAGLNPGDHFRMVFVTKTTTTPTSPLIATYDSIVTLDAGLGGIGTYNGASVLWQTIGSTATVNAVTRLPKDSVPIFLPDGKKVAASGTALWSTQRFSHYLLHEINEHADTTPTAMFAEAWTGTFVDGTVVPSHGLGSTMPAYGASYELSSAWVYTSTQTTRLASLYGFSEVLTVPQPQQAAAVPEPGTLTLMLLGIGGLFGARLTRLRAAGL
jgi:hypothetical protein